MNDAKESTCAIVIFFIHAQLTDSEVDSYVDSIPPSCQLELHLQRTEPPFESLEHRIKVTGIKGLSSIAITRYIDLSE